jgi:LmbE family N-acetylglucosaminyl deacetylase
MNLTNPAAEIFVPDGAPEDAALARITHLGIGAHADDLEFMAFHGIVACYESAAFCGVTCTNGADSPRAGEYADSAAAEMRDIRRSEQNAAAKIGHYGAMIQLDHSSAAVKEPRNPALHEDLISVLRATKPRVIYTHNLADKHDTHVAVAVAAIRAMRALPPDERPETVHGCEVWRDLDWLPDAEKIVHDLGGHDALANALNLAFASQIAGGKRYDLGVMGRRRANATFFQPHAVDRTDSLAFAMDLTPLVRDDSLDIADFACGFIDRFRDEVLKKLRAVTG